MFFDYEQVTLSTIMTYPDCVFAGLPAQPPIEDNPQIGGNAGTSIAITGAVAGNQ